MREVVSWVVAWVVTPTAEETEVVIMLDCAVVTAVVTADVAGVVRTVDKFPMTGVLEELVKSATLEVVGVVETTAELWVVRTDFEMLVGTVVE